MAIHLHEHRLSVVVEAMCEVHCKDIGQNKLSKSSSHHFDDFVATVYVLRSDQSAQYYTFFTVKWKSKLIGQTFFTANSE